MKSIIQNTAEFGFKALKSRAKGALSGNSSTLFSRVKNTAFASMGLLGTAGIIKHVSTSKKRQDNLRFRANSTFRGF